MQKQTKFMSTEAIVKYLFNKDDKIETLVLCKPDDIELITTDYNLHEALGSIKDRNCFELNKLVKFLESVKVVSYENVHQKPKPVLTEDRVNELRQIMEDKNG